MRVLGHINHFDTVQQFIETARRETDDAALGNYFFDLVKLYGFTHYACVSHVNPAEAPPDSVILQNYPDSWAEFFYQNRLEKIDPVLRTSLHRSTPWNWDDRTWVESLSRDQRRILHYASEFELGKGIAPLQSRNFIPATCTLVYDREIDRDAVNAIHLMAIYLHEAAVNIRSRQECRLNGAALTDQQRACLELAAQGKSDWVIGKILNLSHHTVNRHILNTSRRLGVATRMQAVIRALFLGEIRFFDVLGSCAATGFTGPIWAAMRTPARPSCCKTVTRRTRAPPKIACRRRSRRSSGRCMKRPDAAGRERQAKPHAPASSSTTSRVTLPAAKLARSAPVAWNSADCVACWKLSLSAKCSSAIR